MADPVNQPRRRPEVVAAIVNALVVFLLPLAAIIVGYLNDNAVHPQRSFVETALIRLPVIALGLAPFVPFAMLAGWRTWVHAVRYHAREGTGWQGVAEAGGTGFVAALIVLAPGIATRPRDAGPYIIVYGGGALLLGLTIGLILWITAVVVLRLRR